MDSKRGFRRSHPGLKPTSYTQNGTLSQVKPGTKFDKPVYVSSPRQRRKIAKQRARGVAQATGQPWGFKFVLKFLGR